MPVFVEMDLATDAEPTLELAAYREHEVGLISARRVAPLRTNCLLNVDALVILDFDETRRLAFLEIVAPFDKLPIETLSVPEPQCRGILLLSETVFREGSITVDDDVILARCAETETYLVDFDAQCQSGDVYALGPGVACRVHDDVLKALYLSPAVPTRTAN
jgi:hypothetical protein